MEVELEGRIKQATSSLEGNIRTMVLVFRCATYA